MAGARHSKKDSIDLSHHRILFRLKIMTRKTWHAELWKRGLFALGSIVLIKSLSVLGVARIKDTLIGHQGELRSACVSHN